jgi:hypothetical protein
MLKSTYFAIMMAGATALAFCPPVCAEPQPTAVPDFSIEKSCGMFAGHPRPLALCLSQETNYRGEVTGMWAKTPDPDPGEMRATRFLVRAGQISGAIPLSAGCNLGGLVEGCRGYLQAN